MKIGLVSCGARKLDHPAPARELYTGTLFRLASAYAERTCDEWYVLSALHGLVHPDEVLLPYDLTLAGVPIVGRWAWAAGVLDGLEALGLRSGDTHWVVLAGWAYREFLTPRLRGTVKVPLEGLRIGQQIARLKKLLEESLCSPILTSSRGDDESSDQ